MSKKPVMLCIMDGFGWTPDETYGNAVAAANKPNLDKIFANYPMTTIQASGMAVGLPDGQMGNSEVGHTNMGAGRIVYQQLTLITKSIKDGEMFKLDTKEIFYIESVDNKTFIYCKNNVYETKQKLYELEEILKGTKFFRCSKSMILNIGKIRSVSPSVNSRFEAKLVNGETAIISRQYVPTLKKKLGM